MDEKEYSVSEAVRLIGVESHVLRYWEEELQVAIRRTSQGHRVYSAENVAMFRRVKLLKESGLQLKAIRVLLDGERQEGGQADFWVRELVKAGLAGEPGAADQMQAGQAGKVDESERQEARQAGEADARERLETGQREISEADLADQMREIARELNRQQEEDSFDGAQDEEDLQEYEIVTVEEQTDHLRQFETILKNLMEEVVAKQNEKLEQAIVNHLREELEEVYLRYAQQLMQEEAAAAKRRTGLGAAGWLHRLAALIRRK